MRKGFTFIELTICICIVAVIAAMVIPNLVEGRERAKMRSTIIGQTILIGGIKCLVNDYADGKFKVVILGSPAIEVEMPKKTVEDAYAEYTKTHLEKQ